MKVLLAVLVSVGVVGRVWAQDGSFVLDSRGVHLEQGLTPSTELMQNHQAFSQDFKLRSQESARAYSLGDVSFNDPIPDYSWAYEVDARSTGDRKSAREERRGDVVVGQYSVHDPDGSLRVVDYSVAPGTGFQASVSKKFIAEGFQNQDQYFQESRLDQFQSQESGRDQILSQQNRNQYSLNANKYSQTQNRQNRNQYQDNQNQDQQNQYRESTNQYEQSQNQNQQNQEQYQQNRNQYQLNRFQYRDSRNQQNRDQYQNSRNLFQNQQNRNQYNQYQQTSNQKIENRFQQNRNQYQGTRNQYQQNRDQLQREYQQNFNQYQQRQNQYSQNRDQYQQNRNQYQATTNRNNRPFSTYSGVSQYTQTDRPNNLNYNRYNFQRYGTSYNQNLNSQLDSSRRYNYNQNQQLQLSRYSQNDQNQYNRNNANQFHNQGSSSVNQFNQDNRFNNQYSLNQFASQNRVGSSLAGRLRVNQRNEDDSVSVILAGDRS